MKPACVRFLAALVSLTACDQASPAPPGAAPPPLSMDALPGLAAALTPLPPSGSMAQGGNLDTQTPADASASVTLVGWALMKASETEPSLSVYAPGASAVASITRNERPDVVQVLGDEALRFSGFTLTLALEPGRTLEELCITTRDAAYAERLIEHGQDVSASCPAGMP